MENGLGPPIVPARQQFMVQNIEEYATTTWDEGKGRLISIDMTRRHQVDDGAERPGWIWQHIEQALLNFTSQYHN
jgi:hypothetical protein